MTTATKDELERAIAAMWNDIDVSLIRRRNAPGSDEWSLGYEAALMQCRELVGIVVKTYRIDLTINDEEEK